MCNELIMLDKNGIPLQFPPSAFSAVPSGVPPTWPPPQPPTQPQAPQIPPFSTANSGSTAAQIPLSMANSLVGHPHHHANAGATLGAASAALAQG